MARPRPNNYRQDVRKRTQYQEQPQDWQELRSDLLELLNEVERHEFEEDDIEYDAPAPRQQRHANPIPRQQFQAPHQDRHRHALNSVAETLERFNDRSDARVPSAIEQIRGRHADVPNRRSERAENHRQSVQQMSARLENLGQSIKTGDTRDINSQDITNQLSQLTHTVELLAGAVGESGQVKRLESQIAGLADVVADAPLRGQSELNQRLERLAASVEHMSDAQHQLADRPVAMIEDLAGQQDRGFDSIEAGVRGIYDRIDALEQNIGINPEDIERLSLDMRELVHSVQAGNSDGSLVSKIEALNARMNGIEADENISGGFGGDIEALRDAVRDAIEPRFFEINSKIDTLDGKMKTKNGGHSVELEDQIRQLMARMDQTGTQLSEIAQFRSENPDGSTDFSGLADLVAERTSKAVAKSAKTAFDSSGSLDARVHDGIQQVDKRLARLENTLKRAATSGAKPTTAAAKPAKSIKQLTPVKAKTQQVSNAASPKEPAAESVDQVINDAAQDAGHQSSPRQAQTSDTSDTMRSNPADDRPLVDQGFGNPEFGAPVEPSSNGGINRGIATEQPSPQLAAKTDPIPRMGPAGFDPNSVEPPRRPRSSFADDTGSTFVQPERVERAPTEGTETGTSRSTFIEAARRAAQRQNPDDDAQTPSLISRLSSKLRPPKLDAPEHMEAETADQDVSEPTGLRARLAGLGRKKSDSDIQGAEIIEGEEEAHYRMNGSYQEPHDDETPGFITRYKRPLILAGLLVSVSLLALNLVERRFNDTPSNIVEAGPVEAQIQPAAPAELMSQPLLDPQPTGSIDPFMRKIPGTGLSDQLMSAPLDDERAALQNGPRVDALETGAFSIASGPATSANKKFEMPPEGIGPLELREAAANGDPRAQFEVAAIFSEGRAVPADSEAAALWYERAAALGFAPAQYRIGNIYEHGQGAPKDLAKAKIWYERAAEAGNRMSMHNLAAMYASGSLGKQDFLKAAAWFERAAGLGLTDSQFNLGMLHARGLGVPQDMATSYKWFSLAALRGDDGAIKARDDVARSLDADTINGLRAELASWQSLKIDLGANFAPIGTWSKDFSPGNSIGEKSVIMEVQSALNRLGYNVGTPDGLMGPRTSDAISTFERGIGMSESGAINPRLLAVLGSQPV